MATPRSSASRTSFPPGGPISSIPNTCWIYTRKPARSTSAVWRRITTGSTDRTRREVLLQYGGASRRVRSVEVRASAALELRGGRTEERYCRDVQEGRAKARAEVRGERAPGAQLSLVLPFAH